MALRGGRDEPRARPARSIRSGPAVASPCARWSGLTVRHAAGSRSAVIRVHQTPRNESSCAGKASSLH